ncbi:hypothetical protein EKK70_16285, partial [Desulfovibrio sp. DS-1]
MPSKQTRIFARTPLCDVVSAYTTTRPTTTAGASSTSAAPDALGMPSRAITRRALTRRVMPRTGHHAATLFTLLLVGAFLLLGQASPALAHRVNIFAWVEGGAIRCESSFSSGNPTREAKVTVRLAGSNTVMGTAVTDAKGRCALPITPELRAAKADLVIEVQAGEGHRNTWTMPAEEYLAAPVVESAAATSAAPAPPAASPATPQAATPQA